MSTRISQGLAFLASIFFSVVVTACATQVVSSSTEPRKAGAACAFHEQCVSGRCSVDFPAGECGICLDVRKLGESCVGPNQSCNRSAVCEDGICQSRRALVGETCLIGGKGGDPCDDELYCDAPQFEQGTCVAPVAVGGSCELSSSKCVKGAYCDGSGVCAIPPTDSCVLLPCGAGFFCDDQKTCRWATLKAGQRCGIVDGKSVDDGCELGTACGHTKAPGAGVGAESIDTCLPLRGEGGICIRQQCAAGFFCGQWITSGVDVGQRRCEAEREEGEECNPVAAIHIDCKAGLECRRLICERACD